MTYTDQSSKKIRADSYTKYLLEIIHERAVNDEVRTYVKDVIDHVGHTRYRGGKTLLELAYDWSNLQQRSGKQVSAIR